MKPFFFIFLPSILFVGVLCAADNEVEYVIPHDSGFDHQFGPRFPGEFLQVTVTPEPGVTLFNSHVDNPSLLGWVGHNPFLTGISGGVKAGEHIGTFSGNWSRGGGLGGTPPKWNGQARASKVDIKHKTIAMIPADRERVTVGICEEVIFFTDPPVDVDWSINGGGTLSGKHGPNVIATMPLAETKLILTATYHSQNIPTNLNVIKPTEVVMVTSSAHHGTKTVLHKSGRPGAGFIADPITLLPLNVSFYNILMYEDSAIANASGCFADANGAVHKRTKTPFGVGQDNDCLTIDRIRTLGVFRASGNQSGAFIWSIPWQAVNAQTGEGPLLIDTLIHKCISTSAGTATQSKGGASRTFALYDATFTD